MKINSLLTDRPSRTNFCCLLLCNADKVLYGFLSYFIHLFFCSPLHFAL